ncbi:hypothetical protein PIB30_096322, partial [Stylosanthes scabra]|nr:hypothetical protein [Stylosanthes scabra]
MQISCCLSFDSVKVAVVEPRKQSRARVFGVAVGNAVSLPPVLCGCHSLVVLRSRRSPFVPVNVPPFTLFPGTLEFHSSCEMADSKHISLVIHHRGRFETSSNGENLLKYDRDVMSMYEVAEKNGDVIELYKKMKGSRRNFLEWIEREELQEIPKGKSRKAGTGWEPRAFLTRYTRVNERKHDR